MINLISKISGYNDNLSSKFNKYKALINKYHFL